MTDLKPVSMWEGRVAHPPQGFEISDEYLNSIDLATAEETGYAVDHQRTNIAEDVMISESTDISAGIGHTAIVDTAALDPNGSYILKLLDILKAPDNSERHYQNIRKHKARQMSFRGRMMIPALDLSGPYTINDGIDWDSIKGTVRLIQPQVLNCNQPLVMDKLKSLIGFAAVFNAEVKGIRYKEARNRLTTPESLVMSYANFSSISSAYIAQTDGLPFIYRNAYRNQNGSIVTSFSELPRGHIEFGNRSRAFVSRPIIENASAVNGAVMSYFLRTGEKLFTTEDAGLLAGYLNKTSKKKKNM